LGALLHKKKSAANKYPSLFLLAVAILTISILKLILASDKSSSAQTIVPSNVLNCHQFLKLPSG